MPKILVPVDGSEPSLRAVRHAARRVKAEGGTVHLINVQAPLPQAVSSFMDSGTVKDFHRAQAAEETAPAEAILRGDKIAFERHVTVGTPGEAIAGYAKEAGMDEIVMGARGLGATLSLLLGSVTTKVLHLTDKPVTVIK